MGVKAKLKRSSPKVLNAWLLFAAILIIVFSFLYYSFFFVKNNEKGQVENRFRVLAQVGKNVGERKKGFELISGTALKSKEITAKVEELNKPGNTIDRENQEKAADKLKQLLILVQQEIKKANECLNVAVRDKEAKKDQEVSFQGDRLIVNTREINYKDKDDKTVSKEIYIYINVNDFFKPLQRTDVFDELLIIQEEKNIPGNSEEKKKTSESVGKVLYHTFQGNIDIPDLEKLKSSQQGIESGYLRDIEISKIQYKLFLQPLRLDDGEKWYVGGLAIDKKFGKEARKLRADVIIPFLIVFSIFLLSIPILKLFLMSKFEQLNINDIVLTTISVNFGTIALLILFMYTIQVKGDTAKVENNLQNLANRVKMNFTEELKKAYQELECFESSEFLLNYEPSSKDKDNFVDILTKPRSIGEYSNYRYQIPFPAIYPFFKGVFWMDEGGEQILQFSTRNYGGHLINVENRGYFQEAGNWRVPEAEEPNAEEPGAKFMLESITSMTSGENLAAISIKSKFKEGKHFKAHAAAMTTQLTSVINTIMPAGYGFCIIDKTGEVWFHSNTRQNHQENFISEVENDKPLLSAIAGNREKHLVLEYQDKKHGCFFMPVPDIPLYIVTFHDLRYTSAVQVTIILHIVLFFITLALFIGLLFISEACCNYRKSLLKRKYVPFEWFRPLIKNKDTYRNLILSNLVIVVFLILFKIIARTLPFETFFLCLSALLYSFIYNYYSITRNDTEKYRLNKYWLLCFSLFFVILVDLAAFFLLDKFILLFGFQVVLFILLVLAKMFGFQVVLFVLLVLAKMRRPKFESSETHSPESQRNWIRSYILFLLSWLLVVGVVPVILYYLDVHSYEKEVALKHFQVKLAEEIENRDFEIEEFYSKKISNPDNPLVMETKASRKESGRYEKIIGDTEIINNTIDDYEKLPNTFDDSTFNKFASILKLPFNRVAAERRAFVFPAASDNSFTWKKQNDKLILRYQKKRFPFANQINNKDDPYMYVASMIDSKIPMGFSLLLISAAIFLLSSYFLIRFAARMVFGVNLPGIDNIRRTNAEARDEMYDSIKAGSHVIIYCPGSIEMKSCEDALKNLPGKLKAKKIESIDLKPGSGTLAKINESSEERLIIIKNLELHLNDTEKYLNNMNQVVSLLRSRNFQVVVLMSRPLEELIEFYEEKLNEASSKEASPSEKEVKPKYKEIIDGLNEINDGFLPMYIPLKTMDDDNEKNQPQYPGIEKIQDDDMRSLIENEFQAAEHFKKIFPGVYRYSKYLAIKNRDVPGIETREEMIIKIQELMQQYYNELLSSCSKKEKYILYDIAQDMFVNVNNLDAINTLLKKGLLVYDGEFKLMNESFRNYILRAIDADELNQYMRTLYPKWRSYKAPLLFIAFGVAVFLAFQGDLLGKVDALVATALGGVAIVTKFSTVFFGDFKNDSK